MPPERVIVGRWLLVALLFCAASAGAAEPSDTTSPFLWQVAGDKTTHFLLGSVHLLPKAADQLPLGIRQAYESADSLVFESDIEALSNRSNSATLIDAARAPHGLSGEIDADTLARVRTRIRQLNMPSALCEGYRPWFCALSLELFAYQRAGFRGEFGLDRQLYDAARRAKRRIAWFEAPKLHLNLFMAMSGPLSRQFLAAALSERNPSRDEPVEMYRAWRNNDTKYMAEAVAELKHDYPAVHAHLLVSRNRAWLPELKRRLALPQRQMFVVGAAHLIGPDGLIASLEAAGFKVSPYIAVDAQQHADQAPVVELARH